MPRSPLLVDAQQFAALPLRHSLEGLEVMLITSRETGRWVLPKGWAEPDLTGAELASKEAFEEAGLLGQMCTVADGSYQYAKRLGDGSRRQCTVTVFCMTVGEELQDWPERHQRRRMWFKLDDAARVVAEADLATLLLGLRAREASA